MGAFVFGFPVGLYRYVSGASIAVASATPVAAAVIIIPFSTVTSTLIRRRMLSSPASRWVVHWCEVPDGQLAIRMTRPQPATDDSPEFWPGRNLFGEGGAGRRLLGWLRNLADDNHAVVIIKTTTPQLVAHYQSIGFAVTKAARLRVGPAWQLGTTVLRYPREQSRSMN